MNLFKEKETKEKKLNCGFSSSKRPMDNLSCKNAHIRLVAVEQINFALWADAVISKKPFL